MKCCVHHTLPSGHVIPFCAYNVLYREGHVALPALTRALQEGGIGAASAVEATSP
jgi:7,8-dihydro-6-hydroxymethylpterin dimethyltransferase